MKTVVHDAQGCSFDDLISVIFYFNHMEPLIDTWSSMSHIRNGQLRPFNLESLYLNQRLHENVMLIEDSA